MTLKTLLLITALLLPVSVLAVPKMDAHPLPPHHRADQLAKELGLSEEQETKLDEVFKQQHEKFRAIHEESLVLVKQILSPEQMAKWENLKQQGPENRKEKVQKPQ